MKFAIASSLLFMSASHVMAQAASDCGTLQATFDDCYRNALLPHSDAISACNSKSSNTLSWYECLCERHNQVLHCYNTFCTESAMKGSTQSAADQYCRSWNEVKPKPTTKTTTTTTKTSGGGSTSTVGGGGGSGAGGSGSGGSGSGGSGSGSGGSGSGGSGSGGSGSGGSGSSSTTTTTTAQSQPTTGLSRNDGDEVHSNHFAVFITGLAFVYALQVL